MNPRYSRIIFIYLIVHSTYFILLLQDYHIIWLCREDGVIENLGALFFIITSGLFFSAYIHSFGSGNNSVFFHRNRNIFYLLLGILFLICFGEEISWGQRIFNWETPALLSEINSQRETNLHNIWLLNGQIPGQPSTRILGIRLNMNSLFSVFWLFFCVIVPLMDKASLKTSMFLGRIRMPIAPLWIGALFLTHAISFHIIYNFLPYNIPAQLAELRETNYAFIFFVFAYHEHKKIHKNL